MSLNKTKLRLNHSYYGNIINENKKVHRKRRCLTTRKSSSIFFYSNRELQWQRKTLVGEEGLVNVDFDLLIVLKLILPRWCRRDWYSLRTSSFILVPWPRLLTQTFKTPTFDFSLSMWLNRIEKFVTYIPEGVIETLSSRCFAVASAAVHWNSKALRR